MKNLEVCVFYITARKTRVNLGENPELKVCYECRGYNINCSKQLLVKINPGEYRNLQNEKKD